MQAYSVPSRAAEPTTLPDIEVFRAGEGNLDTCFNEDGEPLAPGWYWQACFPGCLPDGEPVGPFDSEAEALADAREDCDV